MGRMKISFKQFDKMMKKEFGKDQKNYANWNKTTKKDKLKIYNAVKMDLRNNENV